LGPLLFAIVLQDLILKIASECPDLDINLWYLDDGTLMGNAADLYKAWTIISDYGPVCGLQANVSKCMLFWPNMQSFSDFSLFPNEIVRTNVSIEVLGCPIGSSSFIGNTVKKRVEKIGLTIEAVSDIADTGNNAT
jgi:hypothetical protein